MEGKSSFFPLDSLPIQFEFRQGEEGRAKQSHPKWPRWTLDTMCVSALSGLGKEKKVLDSGSPAIR